MEVTPTISAAKPRISARDYQDYLKSERWRKVRNAALKRANYTCSTCPSKRDLRVHHLTYERLGAEHDDDLQVLCKVCHSGEHFNQLQDELGIYTRLASEAIRKGADRPSEIREVMRELCIQHRVAYVPWKVDTAINRVSANRLPLVGAPAKAMVFEPAPAYQDATPAEAAGLLRRVGLLPFIKTMPSVERSQEEQRAHEEKIRAQIEEMRGPVEPRPKGRSLRDRLEDIFAGR